MGLKIYNSLSKKNEDFVPLVPGQVTMYVCGPTVYDFLHVGNFRGPVFFNMVCRWLEASGYKVRYALNFTDVDDKIINRANERGIAPQDLAENFISEYKKDFFSLGLRAHDLNPKVTDTMPEIVQMVSTLIEKNKAYVAGQDVLFSIQSFAGYGKLSGRQPDELLAGARVEVDEKKQNPMDFALWKGAKPGEPAWSTPWGQGRPGWHIECSAMIQKHFGAQIDIHGGGTDLIFPHHENEIAQSEACSGQHFVNYWMHVGMLNFGGQKMSKSLGNIVSLRHFVESHNAELYKWIILNVHYRSLCDFSEEAISRSVTSLARIYSALSVAESYLQSEINSNEIKPEPAMEKLAQECWQKFTDFLNDDFATPQAFAAVFDLVRAFNAQVKPGMKPHAAIVAKAKAFVAVFAKISQITALFGEKPAEFLQKLDDMLLKDLKLERSFVNALVQERWQARTNKDFKRSDELRDQLLQMGISVMDTAQGTLWEVTK